VDAWSVLAARRREGEIVRPRSNRPLLPGPLNFTVSISRWEQFGSRNPGSTASRAALAANYKADFR